MHAQKLIEILKLVREHPGKPLFAGAARRSGHLAILNRAASPAPQFSTVSCILSPNKIGARPRPRKLCTLPRVGRAVHGALMRSTADAVRRWVPEMWRRIRVELGVEVHFCCRLCPPVPGASVSRNQEGL